MTFLFGSVQIPLSMAVALGVFLLGHLVSTIRLYMNQKDKHADERVTKLEKKIEELEKELALVKSSAGELSAADKTLEKSLNTLKSGDLKELKKDVQTQTSKLTEEIAERRTMEDRLHLQVNESMSALKDEISAAELRMNSVVDDKRSSVERHLGARIDRVEKLSTDAIKSSSENSGALKSIRHIFQVPTASAGVSNE